MNMWVCTHTHTLSTKGLNNSCFGIKTFTHLVPVERKGGRVRENERERYREKGSEIAQ